LATISSFDNRSVTSADAGYAFPFTELEGTSLTPLRALTSFDHPHAREARATALAYQEGFVAAIERGDGLAAALHMPAWIRQNLDDARLLLLYVDTSLSLAIGPSPSCLASWIRRDASNLAWKGSQVSNSAAIDRHERVEYRRDEYRAARIRLRYGVNGLRVW
jgi:hypothetical protein